jgi:hypothetical protein
MGSIIWLTGALVTVIGAYLLLDTDKFRLVFEWVMRDKRLLRISLLRLLLAFGFYFGAEQTRLPDVTLILAGLFLVSAIAVPVMGEKPVRSLVNWWLARGNWLAIPWCVIAMAFGIFLMWLAWPAYNLPAAN